MTARDHQEQERRTVEELLPWYVTGKLDADEAEFVRARIAADPDLERQLALVREELVETVRANEDLAAPPSRGFERLMADLASEPARTRAPMRPSGFLAWISSLSPAALGASAVAAALIICLQAALLIGVMIDSEPRRGDRFTVAGDSGDAVRSGTLAIISFQPDANIKEISAFLQEHGVSIVDGPQPGNLFSVRIGPSDMSADERDAVLEKLQARTDLLGFLALSD